MEDAFDRDPHSVAASLAIAPTLEAYPDLYAVLPDRAVAVVDIVRPSGTCCPNRPRTEHVLAQEPLCLDVRELAALRAAAPDGGATKLALDLIG